MGSINSAIITINNACNYIILDIFYFTVINQLNIVSNYLQQDNTELSFFFYTSLLQINDIVFDYILNDVMNKAFYCSYSEIEYFWNRSSAMQNGFYNKDLVLIQVLVSDFLIKTNTYQYVPTEMNEHVEYVITELVFYVKCLLTVYFFLIYFVFFINSFYGIYSKLDKFIDRISGSIDSYIESEKEISPVDDFFLVVCYYVVVYSWLLLSISFLYYLDLFECKSVIAYMPILLIIVLSMPSSLIYDCGILFITYLRGVGATTILFLEWIYDCLATLIMFVRLLVQHIRFVLMFFAFFEVLEIIYYNRLFPMVIYKSNYEHFLHSLSNGRLAADLACILYVGIIDTVKLLYQLGHFLFTITSHFFAYFALVFWLFSFLYTSFFNVRLETLFKKKRL